MCACMCVWWGRQGIGQGHPLVRRTRAWGGEPSVKSFLAHSWLRWEPRLLLCEKAGNAQGGAAPHGVCSRERCPETWPFSDYLGPSSAHTPFPSPSSGT